MPNPPDDFFKAQERQLSLFTDRLLLDYLELLESARKDLLLVIGGPESFDKTQALELMPQIDRIALDVKNRIYQQQSVLNQVTPLALEHTTTTISYITSQSIAINFNQINSQVLERFGRNELEKVTRMVDSELSTIKSVLFTKVGVKGENPRQVAKALAGKDSPFAKKFNHVQTILRTETSTIYNAQALDSIKQANAVLPEADQLKKRIVETLDANRNHPISRVLNGQVKPFDEPFTASESAIIAAANAIKKKPQLKAIFWTKKNGVYSGFNLPAHYNERGIVVASE